MDEELIYCSSCRTRHKASAFYQENNARGYSYVCKEAKSRKLRIKYNNANLGHPNRLAPDGTSWCSYHKEFHPIDEFPPNPNTFTRCASWCRIAYNEYNKNRKKNKKKSK